MKINDVRRAAYAMPLTHGHWENGSTNTLSREKAQ
jgi:hypothetical protein